METPREQIKALARKDLEMALDFGECMGLREEAVMGSVLENMREVIQENAPAIQHTTLIGVQLESLHETLMAIQAINMERQRNQQDLRTAEAEL